MQKLNVVIDTNILVSALKGSVKLNPIYTAFKEDRFILVVSVEILKELAAVLYRPRLKIESRDIKELFRMIKLKALRIKLPAPFIDICRDPKDNFILELAVLAKAKAIVSGDKDLLVLKTFGNIPILTAKEFIKRLKK